MPSIRVHDLLVLLVMVSVQGCALHDRLVARQSEHIDAWANPWLGKTKDARMTVLGPPDTCAAVSDGEVCEWVASDVSAGGGSLLEHHISYTYQDGIATAWNYQGPWGRRSNRDHAMQDKEPGLVGDKAHSKPGM